jgi:hypothetical protein
MILGVPVSEGEMLPGGGCTDCAETTETRVKKLKHTTDAVKSLDDLAICKAEKRRRLPDNDDNFGRLFAIAWLIRMTY